MGFMFEFRGDPIVMIVVATGIAIVAALSHLGRRR